MLRRERITKNATAPLAPQQKQKRRVHGPVDARHPVSDFSDFERAAIAERHHALRPCGDFGANGRWIFGLNIDVVRELQDNTGDDMSQ